MSFTRSQRAAPFAALAALLSVGACVPPSPGTCLLGTPVTIPATDLTPPTLAIDFIEPNGQIISVASGGPIPAQVISPGGDVTINAVVTDPEGVRDAQLWIAERNCTTQNGITSCSGPGLLGAPTASNPDGGQAGQTGCTQRLVTQTVQVVGTSVRNRSHEVTVLGVNFGGQQTMVGLINLLAP